MVRKLFTGVLVNAGAIVLGGLLGIILRNISEEMKDTVTKGIGLGVVVLGLQMALTADSFLAIIISLCVGAMIGEALGIESGMNKLGLWLERRLAHSGGQFAEGFVTASLIFVIGSMGIIGSIESGVSGVHTTLFTKSVMDGFMAIMLTASFGSGVLFASIPILIYQGAITLGASLLVHVVPAEFMTIMLAGITAIGGILIIAIGLNILKLTMIRVSNFLPSIVLYVIWLAVQYTWF